VRLRPVAASHIGVAPQSVVAIRTGGVVGESDGKGDRQTGRGEKRKTNEKARRHAVLPIELPFYFDRSDAD
jgi:hypothetical protein